jgi:hypothetical protein
MQEIKDKINEKDYLREVMEEKRMSQELKVFYNYIIIDPESRRGAYGPIRTNPTFAVPAKFHQES